MYLSIHLKGEIAHVLYFTFVNMENEANTNNLESVPLPPPPPIGLLDLTPPPLTEHSYERYFLRQHMAFING
jgi:hypothetical protein